MSESLKPCPFCGGENTLIHENKMWTGLRTQILSVEVRHWCDDGDGFLRIKGWDSEQAIKLWNTRIGV